jgi:ribose transport system permease protein
MTISMILRRAWKFGAQQYAIILILILVCTLFACLSRPFLSVDNLTNILLQASSTAIAAIGMTFVLILAEVDISIGSLMALAMTIGWMVAVIPGVPGDEAPVNAWIYPVGLFAGVALGMLNGFMITQLKISALIATLSTMFAFRGIAWKMVGAGDKPFSDSAVEALGRSSFLGLGVPVYLMIGVAIAAAIFLHRMPLGRYIYAIGGSQRSAIETGLPIGRIRLIAYGFSGFCCSLAGLITIGRVGVLQANLGVGFEFTVIVAVVLGGTSLLGGRGSIVGSILGAILLVVIENGLNLLNSSVYIYDVLKGLILIFGVMIDVALLSKVKGNPGVGNWTKRILVRSA